LPATTESAKTQTIALVDALNDPHAEQDLKVYDEIFKLPLCTTANGCFTKVNQEGKRSPLPETSPESSVEISIDIELAHATCRECHILLVEADSTNYKDYEMAEDRAVAMGATEISNSWYGEEPVSDSAAFNHPGTVITAASGDYGYRNWEVKEETPVEEIKQGQVNYPASSPHVVAVGGTSLELESPPDTWSETVWNDGGSGCSEHFAAPPWQQELPDWASVGCASKRAVADIAAEADPYPGFAIYDSIPYETRKGWQRRGGTSAASPLIAGVFALAGGAHGVEYPAKTLYENERKDELGEPEPSLRDITSGTNGECATRARCSVAEQEASCNHEAICVAGPGYDGPSGVGTPVGIKAFEATGEPGKAAQAIEFTSSAPGSASVGGPTYTVAASASSGLATFFTSGTPFVCAVEGSTVSFLGVGTCTIDADQAGDGEYKFAPQASQSFSVARGSQLIVFTTGAPGAAVVGGPSYTVAATASPSGLEVSLSSETHSVCSLAGSTVTFIGVGTCTIDANQPGDSDYKPARQASQSFWVAKGSQLVTFTSSAPGSATVGGPAYTVAATASSGLAVSFSSPTPEVCSVAGSTVSFVSAGECTIDANQSGDADYEAAPEAQQSFTVGKGRQLIDFTSSAPGSATAGGAGYAVAATASSGLAVSFSSATPSVCSVNEATVSFVGAGTCTIEANQEGSSDYDAAPQAQQSFTVGSAAASSTLSFVSSFTPTPNSSFSLLAKPTVNPKTGAITFKASIVDPGTFSWLLTFPNGTFGAFPASRQKCDTGQINLNGKCRPEKVIFGRGATALSAAGVVRFTITPSASALKALENALKHGRALSITATLTFQSSLGGSPVVHTLSITDRLTRIGKHGKS
jgi:hypothetical protein